jgi:hypothetical protein
MTSGIQPVRICKSVEELLPGKSYPPITFKKAFSMRAGEIKFGLFGETTWSGFPFLDWGSKSSITTILRQPFKCNRTTYLPVFETPIGNILSVTIWNIKNGNLKGVRSIDVWIPRLRRHRVKPRENNLW